MPIRIDNDLPAKAALEVRYHIFTDRILCSDSCIRVTYGEIL